MVLGPSEVQRVYDIVPVEASSVSMSFMAEALYNFGLVGVVLTGIIWSYLIRFIATKVHNRTNDRTFLFYLMVFPTVSLAYVKSGVSLVYYFLVLSPIWWIFLANWAYRRIVLSMVDSGPVKNDHE